MGGSRITRIDSLRALGALSVAALHVTQPTAPDSWWAYPAKLYEVLAAGHAGVNLFFVISGFVLTLSLERGPQDPVAGASRFIVARTFRIIPAVVFMAAVFALILGYGIVDFVAQSLLLTRVMNGATWTLQLEMVAAPVIVALYFVARRHGPLVIIVAGLVLFALSFSGSWGRVVPALGLALVPSYAFIAGMLLAWFKDEVAAFLSRRDTRLVLLLGFVLLLGWRPFMGGPRWSIVSEVAGSCLILACVSYGRDGAHVRWLDAAWLRFYGTISYSLYLMHPLTLELLPYWAPPLRALYPGVLVAILMFVVTVAIVTPLSWFSYVFVEKPAIRLGRAMLGRAQPQPA